MNDTATRQASGWKIVFWFALAAAVILALQAIPQTGVLLMVFGSILGVGLWICMLVHAMVIWLGVQAYRRRISRAWLLAPTIFYGGWLVLYGAVQAAAWWEITRVKAFNQDATTKLPRPFSVFSSPQGLSYLLRLLRTYQMGPVYSFGLGPDKNHLIARHFADGDECRGTYRRKYDPPLMPGCAVTDEDPHGRWNYRLELSSESFRGALYDQTTSRWRVFDQATGTRVAQAEAAALRTITPIPIFGFGCAVLGTGNWECGLSIGKLQRRFAAYDMTNATRLYPARPNALEQVLSLKRRDGRSDE